MSIANAHNHAVEWGLKDGLKLLSSALDIRPNVKLDIVLDRYHLTTARTLKQWVSVLNLRHDIFTEEYGLKPSIIPIDVDRFDALCDHIIIYDKKANVMVGTYRVNCSLFSNRFYSENEFQLSSFMELPGVKVELGRACIRKEYRNGKTIDLLWKGIALYAKQVNARYLFGCSSVHGTQPEVARAVRDYIDDKGRLVDLPIQARTNFSFEELDQRVENDQISKVLPPLLKSYLTAGAKVAEHAALDREFECFDFLTILDLKEVTPMFKRRYF